MSQLKISALNQSLSDQEVHDVREQWVKYGVAVFPKQSLTLEEYENFSQLFGPYGQEPFLIPMQEHPHIVKLHRKPNEEAAHFGGAWHSDWSFQHAPPSATMLYSEIIPPEGGDTLFANTANAYDDLSDALKKRINSLQCLPIWPFWQRTFFDSHARASSHSKSSQKAL